MIHDLKTLESHLKNLTALGLAEKVLVVSMGDEIALKVPTNATLAQSLFADWCKKHHVAVPGAYNVSYDGSAPRYWYSNLFADQYGLDALATATALLKKYLKNANIGANFSPLTYDPSAYTTAAYLYTVNKGVRAFRSGALTLPWGEDYSWQTPIGSQQMTTLLLDFFRAGKRHGTTKTTITTKTRRTTRTTSSSSLLNRATTGTCWST